MSIVARIDQLLAAMNNPSLPGIDLSLDRMCQLLAALGDPQLKLPPVIHVAGTNGKGSTIAYLRSIYAASGAQSHIYTSPHLVKFNERFVIAGAQMTDAQLLPYLERVMEASRDIAVTFFEATTAVAFLAFAEHKADVVLLETGLGGRLDATNLVPNPIATVITPIDYDHMEFLGDTLANIAGEKAGIMKVGTPCISAAQAPAAAEVLIAHAQKLPVPLLLGGRDWSFEAKENEMLLRYESEQFILPKPSLAGAHQFANAALAAVTALHCQHALPITLEPIAQGLAQAIWPARLQHLMHGPLTVGWRGKVMLDGGHNLHAARAIADWAAAHPKLDMICAMMARKDAVGYFHALAPVVDRLVCIPMPNEDYMGYSAAALANAARSVGITNVVEAPSLAAAFEQLQRDTVAPKTLLIAGSLHLAGEVLKNNG